MSKYFFAVPIMAVLASCQANGSAEPQLEQSSATTTGAVELSAPVFVQAACAGCHAVQAPWLSPNPEAPSFAEIVERPGVSGATLKAYLRDAHNYPDVMDFDLDDEQVDLLVGYMGQVQAAGSVVPRSL